MIIYLSMKFSSKLIHIFKYLLSGNTTNDSSRDIIYSNSGQLSFPWGEK